MKLLTHPDVKYPAKCYEELGDFNLDEYYNQCESELKKTFEPFIEEFKGKRLLDLSLNQVQRQVRFLQSGFMYVSNVFISQKKDVIVSSTSIQKSHNLITSPTRQLFINLIGQLDKIRKIYHQKYLKEHLESINDKVMENIQACNEILIENTTKIMKARFLRKPVMSNYDVIIEKMNILDYYISNLIDATNNQQEKDEIVNYLLELGFTQVIDRISIAKDYLNEHRWQKSVQDMRVALELTINTIVRKVQSNSYWKGTMKDGFNILFKKGVITDEIFLNHFKTSNVGIYGFLSIKGIHPEGETTDNFADSDLEAKYCINLVLNAIQYLLTSYENSEHFEKE